TEKANIELMFNDPYWARFQFTTDYPFEVLVLNVTTLNRGFHRTEYKAPADDPYRFADRWDLQIKTVDDYVDLLDRLFAEAKGKAFEDYVMWQLVRLSAKHELPFQIHTGDARIQGSNPMLLVDLIQANPQTKFVLFHGGYPWVGETAAIVMRHGPHVWID